MKGEPTRLLSCLLGMSVGLMIDASAGRLALLGGLCTTSGARDVVDGIALH